MSKAQGWKDTPASRASRLAGGRVAERVLLPKRQKSRSGSPSAMPLGTFDIDPDLRSESFRWTQGATHALSDCRSIRGGVIARR
jgi:hypothetical protein